MNLLWIQKNALYIALSVVLAGILGSLYFSEIKQFPPCNLCWYQRIALYPLAAILITGILRKDSNVYHYVLPLSIFGWFVALYQNLLQWGILSEALAPCSIGVSCTAKYTEYFGFISIPFMSFAAFTIINVCMYILSRKR